MFNKSQSFIEVEVDATMAVMESRKKLVTSFAAGAAPDVAMMVQYWAQDYYDNGILHPIEDYFNKWDAQLGLPAERGRAGALQAGPADPLPAADQHPLLPVLPRRLARGSEARSRRTPTTSSSRPAERDQQAAGSLRHRDARADLLGDPGDPADLGERRRQVRRREGQRRLRLAGRDRRDREVGGLLHQGQRRRSPPRSATATASSTR